MNSSTRYISLVSVCKQPVKNFSNATFMLSFKTMQISMLFITRWCQGSYYIVKLHFSLYGDTTCMLNTGKSNHQLSISITLNFKSNLISHPLDSFIS